jgi:nucleotide-binding universal stress UspA family protein
MVTINRILVTTDFSEYSASALEYAVSLAESYNATIHLIHVVDPFSRRAKHKSGGRAKNSELVMQETAQQAMKKFVVESVDEYVEVKQVIRLGHPADEIARYAKEERMDLIIIATHGRTGLAHVMIGSIAEKVIRISSVPVLAIKPTAVIEKLIAEEDVVEELHLQEPEDFMVHKKN